MEFWERAKKSRITQTNPKTTQSSWQGGEMKSKRFKETVTFKTSTVCWSLMNKASSDGTVKTSHTLRSSDCNLLLKVSYQACSQRGYMDECPPPVTSLRKIFEFMFSHLIWCKTSGLIDWRKKMSLIGTSEEEESVWLTPPLWGITEREGLNSQPVATLQGGYRDCWPPWGSFLMC